ncbi:MAG: RNA polymerase sigma-70 factor (family 1) [Arenicella sp.]
MSFNFSFLTKEEFKICFDELFDAIRNYIYYRCNDEHIATDIAQEAFVKVWEKNIDYHPNKTKGLLYKIAKELWISDHRKQQSAEKYSLSLDEKHAAENPAEQLEYKELKQEYETILSDLPENQREVFLMSRLEDLSYKEIAVRLELSVKAVEKRMSLCLKTLRSRLVYGRE